jgi:hypothetical protein
MTAPTHDEGMNSLSKDFIGLPASRAASTFNRHLKPPVMTEDAHHTLNCTSTEGGTLATAQPGWQVVKEMRSSCVAHSTSGPVAGVNGELKVEVGFQHRGLLEVCKFYCSTASQQELCSQFYPYAAGGDIFEPPP